MSLAIQARQSDWARRKKTLKDLEKKMKRTMESTLSGWQEAQQAWAVKEKGLEETIADLQDEKEALTQRIEALATQGTKREKRLLHLEEKTKSQEKELNLLHSTTQRKEKAERKVDKLTIILEVRLLPPKPTHPPTHSFT